MTKEELISGATRLYNKQEEEYEIDLFLYEQGVLTEQFPEIKEAAKARSYEERLTTEPKKYKRRFAILILLSLVTFYFFFFALPYANVFRYQVFFSILGGVILSILLLMVWAHYKTWTPESIRKGFKMRFTGILFALIILPATILAGINWFVYGSAEDKLLRDHHEEADGVVVYGQSIKTRRADFTTISIQFTTKDGKTMIVDESVPSSMFDHYYKGQKLKLIYYTGDPSVISILQNDSEIRNMLGTEERDITPDDLFTLAASTPGNADSALKQISHAWKYDENSKAYLNEYRNQALTIDSGMVVYVDQTAMLRFPKLLQQMGFELKEDDTVKGIAPIMKHFSNDKFDVLIEMQNDNGQPIYITTVMNR